LLHSLGHPFKKKHYVLNINPIANSSQFLIIQLSFIFSFSFARPKENETKEKGTTGKATFTR
jgi:hypothetical protein